MDSGVFTFRSDPPYNPTDPSTHPVQFDVLVGPLDDFGYAITSKDRRHYVFTEDKWQLDDRLTLNLGLRYDHQKHTPASSDDIAPRAGFAWNVGGRGNTVVRGGVGKFYAFVPVVLDLNLQQNGVRTLFPTISINAATDTCGCMLRPDMISDSQGNPGVAQLSPAGQADLDRRRDAVLAGRQFNRNIWLDSDDRQLPYHMVVERWRESAAVRERRGGHRLCRQRLARSAWPHRHQRAGERCQTGRERVRSVRQPDPGGSAVHALPAGPAGADKFSVRRRLQLAPVLLRPPNGEPMERTRRLYDPGEQLCRQQQRWSGCQP